MSKSSAAAAAASRRRLHSAGLYTPFDDSGPTDSSYARPGLTVEEISKKDSIFLDPGKYFGSMKNYAGGAPPDAAPGFQSTLFSELPVHDRRRYEDIPVHLRSKLYESELLREPKVILNSVVRSGERHTLADLAADLEGAGLLAMGETPNAQFLAFNTEREGYLPMEQELDALKPEELTDFFRDRLVVKIWATADGLLDYSVLLVPPKDALK